MTFHITKQRTYTCEKNGYTRVYQVNGYEAYAYREYSEEGGEWVDTIEWLDLGGDVADYFEWGLYQDALHDFIFEEDLYETYGDNRWQLSLPYATPTHASL